MLGFTKKKKPKVDPKIRFQNRQFNQKLHQARTFKRTPRQIPDNKLDKLMERIGLGNRWAQGAVSILILGILYIVYAPNFLTLQNITVEGLSGSDKKLVEAAVRDNIGSTFFINPQSNLLFLSKERVKQAALSVPSVGSISQIIKDFKNRTIKLVIEAKYERFLIRNNDRVIDIYNDGTVKGQAGIDAARWVDLENPNMIKFDLPATVKNTDTKQFFAERTVSYMNELQKNLNEISGTSLGYITLNLTSSKPHAAPETSEEELDDQTNGIAINESVDPEKIAEQEDSQQHSQIVIPEIQLPLNPEELVVVMNKGGDYKRPFKVYVDANENARDVVLRLNLLLSQTAPDRYNNLSYIDLRIPNRAYVCLINTPCEK